MSESIDSFTAGSADPIRQQAAAWIAKRDAGLTPAEQDEMFEWLAADPRHAEAYAELRSVFGRMDVMIEWRPLHALEPNPDLLAAPIPRRRAAWAWGAVAGVAAALAAAFVLWTVRPAPAEPRLLASGGVARAYERHVLEDGTIVELNQGAQLSLHFAADARRISLLAGEAHFKVAKDPKRPFVVRAAGAAVTAVGTEFNVSLQQDAMEVIVTEGRILVQPPVSPAAEVPAQSLTAGQGTVLSLESQPAPLVVRDYPSELIEQKLAWKSELLKFTDAPLSEVILEFNRRNHTQLVLGDAELGHLRINGALRPTNLEDLIQVLAVTENVQAERHEPSKVVLRRSGPPRRTE